MKRRTHHHHNLRGPKGHGRHRARRGAVGAAILTLLDEQPMHGYELIGALEERSGGRWKPSAGSIYPALHRLEERGLISPADAEADDGKRRYELTDAGRQRLTERTDDTPAPWDDGNLGRHGELRRAMAELSGPAKQIGRFGSIEQVEAAVTAVRNTTAALYQILADRSSADAPTDE
jgi:DNA-binding PadR family transcriptional regulator